MKRQLIKWIAVAVVVVAVTLGCNSVYEHLSDEASQGTLDTTTGAAGFTIVDSAFTDAPISPGGTGGVGPIVTGSEDVVADGEETRSFFTAFQVDPTAEDSAGPKFALSADIDQDGMLDIVTAWNQSQPVQLHLQRRDANDAITFRSITLGGTDPIAIVAGVEVGQINDDGWLDVVILSKATGAVGLCPPQVPGEPPAVISSLDGQIIVLFSPGSAALIPDGDQWTQMMLVNPFIRCRRGSSGEQWHHNQYPGNESDDLNIIKEQPEIGGFTALAVGNVDGIPGDDIVVALNPAQCETLAQLPPTNTVDLWTNPGPGLAGDPTLWGAPFFAADPAVDATCPGSHACQTCAGGAAQPYADFLRVPVALMADMPMVKDILLMDVDIDGDLDVIAAFSNALSRNVRWARNPLVAHAPGGPDGLAAVINGASDGWRYYASDWQSRPVGQVDTGADMITIGDVDADGSDDVLVRSTLGQVVQWFRHPNAITIQPEFPPNDPVPERFNFPWQVFTLTEFDSQAPGAMAIGDFTGDGQPEAVVGAAGAVFWYDSSASETVYDPWAPNTIVQDSPATDANAASGGGTTTAPGSGVGVSAVDETTSINTLLVVDLDGDGRNDIVGTLDRKAGSGLSDDRIVWYRNVRTDEDAVAE